MSNQKEIENAITEATGEKAKIVDFRSASGGCINNSRIISLKDGRQYFVKSSPGGAHYPGMFAAEYNGLNLMAATNTIRVPGPVAYNNDYLILEVFTECSQSAEWLERLGRQLAELHLATRQSQFGFETDNYIGSTQQPNTWTDNWLAFWRDQRIGWQLELLSNKLSADDPIFNLGDRLLAKMDEMLGNLDEPAVLLHGDLWSGNAAAIDKGEPIIFDPASYYGHREAELGIMRMFGGFGPRCEDAYHEVWPWDKGKEERIPLYRLYHELNHLNLFGRSYYQGCIDTMNQLL
ncbi:MAG: phosphotransferase [Gammaproteobacteria bacterium]|nr:phosphotransferase [Gammaproteobacteria bacterium]